MARKNAAFAVFLFLFAGQLGAESVQPNLSNCRGLNYVVGGAKNPTDQWLNYEPDVVTNNLDILDAFGVNAVRVFGNMDVWRHYENLGQATYEDRVEDLVRKAFDRNILVMLILFDSASIGKDPGNVAENAASGWWKTPGDAYVAAGWQANQAEIAHYIGDTMAAVQAAGAGQVIYDVWNEPKLPDAEHVILALETVKAVNSQARTTVGHAGAGGNATLFAMEPLTTTTPVEDIVDVLSHHPYGIFEDHVVSQVNEVAAHGKPHVASEAGNHGRGQSYVHVIDWLNRAGEGFFLWEAFASESPFTGITGLFYSRDNPTTPLPKNVQVRDLEAVNKLLTMAVDRGHNPSKIATLRATEHSGYIPYYPTTYAFTTPDAYDLVQSWNQRYAAETYSQTPLAGYLSTPQTIRPVDFYDTILQWTKRGLEKLDTLTVEEKDAYDACRTELYAKLTAIANLNTVGTVDPQTLIEDLFDDVDTAFSCMASNVAPGTGLHAPANLNTPPEIVYIKTSLSSIAQPSGPPVSNQFELTAEMVINDAERLADIVDADIQFSADGVSFNTLSPTWWTARGYLEATFTMPPMQAGQPFLVKGRVEDASGAWVEEVVPVAPSLP